MPCETRHSRLVASQFQRGGAQPKCCRAQGTFLKTRSYQATGATGVARSPAWVRTPSRLVLIRAEQALEDTSPRTDARSRSPSREWVVPMTQWEGREP